MFTGIIQEIGAVRRATRRGGYLVLSVTYDEKRGKLRKGDSMAVNGVCLTATELGRGLFSADLSGETQRATTLGKLRPGDRVNLERALTASEPMGGHFVLGHVDGVGRISRYLSSRDGLTVTIQAPAGIMDYVVEKGSITVDGVSLTVGPAGDREFSTFIIPETRESTTIGTMREGSPVNLEADYIARLVKKFVGSGGRRAGARPVTAWASED
jgi:riboflavin synthase